MAVVSYNESKSGNNSLVVHGNDEELKKVAEFVNSMYDNVTKDDVDMVNEPPHYEHGMECIDEMVLVFGKEAVMNFCLCNVWKYRYRAPYKGNIEENMEKSRWYLKKYKELKNSTTVYNAPIIQQINQSDYIPSRDYMKNKVWCSTTTATTGNN